MKFLDVRLLDTQRFQSFEDFLQDVLQSFFIFLISANYQNCYLKQSQHCEEIRCACSVLFVSRSGEAVEYEACFEKIFNTLDPFCTTVSQNESPIKVIG